MKNHLFRPFPAALGLLVLTLGLILPTSCTKEVFRDFEDDELVEMTITVGSNTKTVNDGNGTAWVEDDDLTVIHSATSASTPSFWPSQFFYNGDNAFHGTVSRLSATNNWYAVYPYAENNASANNIVFTLPSTQTQEGNASKAHLAGRNFPLYGKAEGVARSTELNLPMKNLLAVAKFNVTNNSDEAITIKEIEYTASSSIAGTFSVDLTGENPVFSGGSSTTAKLTVNGGTIIAAGATTEFYMAIAPYEAAAGTVRQVKVVADDGTPCYRTFNSEVTFKSGVIKNIDFSYDKNHQTPEIDDPGTAGEVDLEIGEEPENGVYLLVYDNGENSMAFAAFDDYKGAKYAIPVSVVDGLVYPKGDLGSRDLSDFAVELENTGTEHPNDAGHFAYNVRNSEGKYVFYATAGGTYSAEDALHIMDINEMEVQGTVYKYYHTFVGDNDGVKIRCSIATGGNSYLLTYSESRGFYYSNPEEEAQGEELHLYQVGETTPKVEQSLEFNPKTVSYDFDKGGDFPEPELTGDYHTTVAFSSKNETIAQVDPQTGVVTIVGPGSTTITATAPAGKVGGIDYKSATATYTIEVTSSNVQIWYKADEIEVGQTYLIVSNGYALQNNNGSVAATAVTVNDDVIMLTAPAALLWEAKTGNQFTNNSQYLGSSTSSSGGGFPGYGTPNLSIGSQSSAQAWTYDAESNLLTCSISSYYTTTYYLYYSNSSNAFTINSSSSDTHIAALYSTTKPADKQFLSFTNSTVRWTVGDGGDHALNQSYDVQAVSGAATTVTYASSNTGVATINGTRITLNGTGATTITATAKEENGYKSATAKYTLRVTTPAPAGFKNLGSFNLENAALTGYLNDASVKYPADDKSTIANNTYASTSVISTYANWSSPSRKDIPAPVELSWDVASTGTATVTVYNDQALQDEVWTWTASEGSKSFDVYNLIPGKTYYCTVVDDSNGNYLLKGTFNTEGRRRMIKVSDTVNANNANNCRDLGGLKTTDGRRIKYGLIFRGTNMTSTKPAEKSIIAEFMNVGLDNDLRSGTGGGSNRDNPFENTGYSVRYIGPGYGTVNDLQNASNYKKTIQAFLDAAKPGTENYHKASYFHCYIGADRTGYTGLMLEGLLGVSLTDCTIDYELTTFSTAAGSRPRNGGQLCYINDAVTFLNKAENGGTGTSLQEKITYYFINKLGISETDIENFKNWVLEPDPEAN
ncbi:MAG: tyrosine-protein phosphatase [Bacteroidales bacterium]|nr:tyrosine-protein phosphatase [Bacteroidales bacterium]